MPYKDSEKRKKYQREWRRDQTARNKTIAVRMLGGKCVRCGYNENIAALEIDHKILKRRKLSDTAPNQATRVVNGRIKLKDVQLLCANCHAIKTYEEDRKKFGHYLN